MPVAISSTPNPNAAKFTVGVDVGGPSTFVAGSDTDNELAAAILSIPGVASLFMSADFVTVSKTPEADWGEIAPTAEQILSDHFGV